MKQKQAAANALIFNLKSALSALLLSNTKSTLILNATTTYSASLLIDKITDGNNDNINIKDLQKQEEKTLDLEACIMILCIKLSAIALELSWLEFFDLTKVCM